MIKASDLRLGNLLQYEGYYAPVNAIWSNGNYELHSDILQFLFVEACNEQVTGIPLTEDWLIKLGFDKIPFEVDKFRRGAFEINLHGCFRMHIYDGKNTLLTLSKNVKCVHQLQNIYFGLREIDLIPTQTL